MNTLLLHLAYSLQLKIITLSLTIVTSAQRETQNPNVKVELEREDYPPPFHRILVNTTLYMKENRTYLYDGLNELNIVEGYHYSCYYITCAAAYPVKWVTNIPLKKFIEDIKCSKGESWKYFNSLRLHDDPFKEPNGNQANINKDKPGASYSIQLMFGLNENSGGLLKCESIENSNLSAHYYFTDGIYYAQIGQINFLPYSSDRTDEFRSGELFWERKKNLMESEKLLVPCRVNRLDINQSLIFHDYESPPIHPGEKLWDKDNVSASKMGAKYESTVGFTLSTPDFKETVIDPNDYIYGSTASRLSCEENSDRSYYYKIFVYTTERKTSKIDIVEDDKKLSPTQNGCILIRNHDKFIFRRNNSDLRPEMRQKLHSLKFMQCNSPDECDMLRQCLDFRGDSCYSDRGQINVGSHSSRWGGFSMETPHNRGLLRCMDYKGGIGFKPIYEYTFVGLDKIRYVLSEDIPIQAYISIDETRPTLYTNVEATFRCHISYFLLVPNIRFGVLLRNGTVVIPETAQLDSSNDDLYDTSDVSSVINSNSNLGSGWKNIVLNLTADAIGIMCFAPLHSSSSWVNVTRRFVARDVKEPKIDKSGGNVARVFFQGDKDFSLHCKADGAPEPKITWILPNNVKKAAELKDKSQIPKLTEIANEDGNSFLTFPPMSKTFEGTYTCLAENPHGRDVFDFVLKYEKSGLSGGAIAGITLGVLAFLVFIAGFVVLLIKYRYAQEQLRDLTEEEVDEFKNGNGKADNHPDGQVDISMLPFKSEYILNPDNLNIEKQIVLGEGQFGVVHRGLLNGLAVAVKTTKSVADVTYVKAFLGELKIMAYIGNHPHIVHFLGAVISQIRERSIQAVVELCPFGNLHAHLRKLGTNKSAYVNLVQNDIIVAQPSGHISTANTPSDVEGIKVTTLNQIDWCRQIADGMNYLASKRVYHGDLAARNVLIFNDNIVKITDFGLSKQLYSSPSYVKKQKVPLPWRWLAIESLRFMEFSIESDVWAFAVTVWEIFTLGETPYPGLTWTNEFVAILSNGMRMGKPQNCPKNIYDKMMKCWSTEVADRPSFSDLANFFEGILKATGISSPSQQNTTSSSGLYAEI